MISSFLEITWGSLIVNAPALSHAYLSVYDVLGLYIVKLLLSSLNPTECKHMEEFEPRYITSLNFKFTGFQNVIFAIRV